ncbi:MAG: AMP-binding protein [Candidatus Rariloculaceae bacterium]
MNRPWLRAYPPGVPAEIDLDQYASLNEMLEKNFERFRNEPAFSNMGESMSFAKVDRLSGRFAAYLQSLPGLSPGDRIAVMLPNVLQYPVAVFGILRAGFVVVNVNPLYTPRELEHQLIDSGARAILVLENFAATVAEVVEETRVETVIVTRLGDHLPTVKRLLTNFVVKYIKRLVPGWRMDVTTSYLTALLTGRRRAFRRVEAGPDDIAFLQYTGGTTGVAKGAALTHRNMVTNVLQSAAWTRPVIEGPGDIVVTPLPLYHIFSLTVNLFSFVELGGHNILITNPRDVPGFIKELKKSGFTYMTGVNTLFVALLQRAEFKEIDFSRLKACMGGGMAVQRAVSEDWQAVTGTHITQGYGLTEASPVISANPLTLGEFNGSVGLPLPSTDVEIYDDNNEPLPIGEVGEICARGPQVMSGYWERPEATAKIMFGDGWLRTGDVGRMDEQGFIFIEDRLKDLIIVSGFNVYPSEIEDVVVSHSGVIEAAVIGIPDDESGEAVKLFVVKSDPELTEQELVAHCRERLTGYKIPRHVEFRDDLPKTNVGKVLKRALRDE